MLYGVFLYVHYGEREVMNISAVGYDLGYKGTVSKNNAESVKCFSDAIREFRLIMPTRILYDTLTPSPKVHPTLCEASHKVGKKSNRRAFPVDCLV